MISKAEEKLSTIAEIGLRLLDFKVLVKLDNEAEMYGHIFIPPSAREESTTGRFICASAAAWSDAELATIPTEHLPKYGERVLCAKYAGRNVKGRDGQSYRLMNDKDIYAVIEFEK